MTRLASVWVTPAAESIFKHNGRAGNGNHRAEPDRLASRHAEALRGRKCAERACHHDLNRAADERDPANGLQIAKRQFQAEREKQQRHADFGQKLHVVNLHDGWSRGVGTDQHAGGDVTDH